MNLEHINDYITSDEAANLLSCSKRTLRRYVSQGLVSKIGNGRATRYSIESVLHLVHSRDNSKLDKMLNQLSSIATTQQTIITRLELLEGIFYARGQKANLSNEDIEQLKSQIKSLLSATSISTQECSDWANDLLKVSQRSINKLGKPLLKDFFDKLSVQVTLKEEVSLNPKKQLILDKIKWLSTFVG